MKRLYLLSFAGLLSSILAGCPIFPNDHGDSSCDREDCNSSGTTKPGECSGPNDCGINETCGQDNKCHSGDCTLWGCNSGFTCVVDPDTHTASCKPGGAGGAGGSGSSSSSASGGAGGGGSVVYCGNPKDCTASETCAPDGTCHTGNCTVNGCIYGYTCNANGACERSNPAACAVDSDCSGLGMGYSCVSGICKQPADHCWDQTTCAGGSKCAAGKCTPGCTSAADCPAGLGYTCDTNLGLCSKPVKVCTITNDCGGAKTVCVAGACVPRSSGPTCPAGTDWVDNGCIASQKATFICSVDGQQDVCAAGSICLHHACYISCAGDPTVCTNQPSLNQCKAVTTTSGAHNVCGSNQNLGGECDPTDANKSCVVGKICIDQFCK
jgi:hypothetical protein